MPATEAHLGPVFPPEGSVGVSKVTGGRTWLSLASSLMERGSPQEGCASQPPQRAVSSLLCCQLCCQLRLPAKILQERWWGTAQCPLLSPC